MYCPQCKIGILKSRTGPYGDFMGCSRYPECKYVLKEKVGSYPKPPPEVPQPPTSDLNKKSEESPVNPILILTDEITALRGELKDLSIFLKERMG